MKQDAIVQTLKQKLAKAHSPYSNVQVAAAVVYHVDGEEHIAYGVNVENVSYGLTVCAERNAVASAVINGMQHIDALYVVSNQDQAISPCGACRQVVTEFMDAPEAPVYCVNHDESKQWESSIGELLPNRFDL